MALQNIDIVKLKAFEAGFDGVENML